MTPDFEPFVSTAHRQDSSKPQLCAGGVKKQVKPKNEVAELKEKLGR